MAHDHMLLNSFVDVRKYVFYWGGGDDDDGPHFVFDW